ncbi:MAG TPA: HNH endonuclease [Deltaproteobacteria bacterium]|nr:HNH endonuclease [Deltaproteobacteria bacterium]
MKLFVGVTDFDWYTYLSSIENIDEVNFWQPSGDTSFKALEPGELFLFKLHSPKNFIVGGGFFAHSTILPVSLAWNSFEIKNGATSLIEMRRRIEKYRKAMPSFDDYSIGCILLEQPFFFPEEQWIPIPPDWSPNIVRGKRYFMDTEVGRVLWDQVQQRLQVGRPVVQPQYEMKDAVARYGAPILVAPRLGQGSFRIIVTDIYNRRCAVTQEKTLPALEAAHIKPFSDSGPHSVQNGILLRSDIHRLFDSGYVTVTSDYRFEVSRRIRDEFENGRDYYVLQGRRLSIPGEKSMKPSGEFISWHNENVYRG